jgi:hypothetical protein
MHKFAQIFPFDGRKKLSFEEPFGQVEDDLLIVEIEKEYNSSYQL